jgi:hypothetical protein
MDPVTIATAAVSLLVPYLNTAANKAAEVLGEKSVALAHQLFGFLRTKFRDDTSMLGAIEDLSEAPQDSDRQIVVRRLLAKAMQQDAQLTEEISKLVGGAESRSLNANTATIVGDSSKLAQVSGSGNTTTIS